MWNQRSSGYGSALAVFGLLVLGACHADDPCDPDEEFDPERYSCRPLPVDTGTSTSTTTDGGTETCERSFGARCSDGTNHTDCPCPGAPFCAVNPADNVGFCTKIGCTNDPCPADFRCFDIRDVAPELESICIPM